jgi:hypothetical protein
MTLGIQQGEEIEVDALADLAGELCRLDPSPPLPPAGAGFMEMSDAIRQIGFWSFAETAEQFLTELVETLEAKAA